MSWIKRRGPASPNPTSAPPVQMYNPNQHSNVQGQWKQQDLQPPPTTNNWYNQPPPTNQQNYPQQSYNQTSQPGTYWNQSFQQPTEQSFTNQNLNQYNQQYSQFNASPTTYYENNSYQQPPQPYTNPPQNQMYAYGAPTPNHTEPQPQRQEQTETDTWNWGWGEEDNSNVQTNTKTNANQLPNNVGESFTDDKSWNWSVEDTNDNSNKIYTDFQPSTSNNQNLLGTEGQDKNLFPKMVKHEKHSPQNEQPEPPTRHTKTDHLTPQWSTESQMSQDSSDLLHTSESDKSHMLSRSSTISESPISGQEGTVDHLARPQLLDFSNAPEAAPKHEAQFYNLQQENREVLPSSTDELKAFKSNATPPPPPLKNQTPPPDTRNPYKRTTGLSHKALNKYKSDPFYSNQSVNLETLPDNSEQPDSIPPVALPKAGGSCNPAMPWAENNEMASITDRNQYLETGHLNNDFNQSSDALPPPGFTRLVVGQLEQNEIASLSDEPPPPGLNRLVVGQPGSNSSVRKDLTELPVGLHRMIPGESSSPETTLRYNPQQFGGDGDLSEGEMNEGANQIRSATIGADTPPVTLGAIALANLNRSETIGAEPLPYPSTNAEARSASSSYNNNIRETNADGANNLDETRRDSIEGEPQDAVGNLISSVRDLSVADNTNGATNLGVPEGTTRRSSRQESTDSEHDASRKSPRDRRDRRYYDKHEQYDREKNRSRYTPSPDRYREKKDKRKYKDRRYEEDTDYYSDKDRERKRDDRERREDYDKKFSSLKRDKDKDRRRRDHRGHREYPRRPDYYNRYEEEYDETSRSRPSSRSDSMHDAYRQDNRHRDRDRDRHRRHHRDPFNPYLQGYSYDPFNPYYQQYQYHYYENLRRTNPQAYAEWYHKYYKQSTGQQSYGTEDRASVHSGRSSANDELAKDRYTRQSYYSQASLNYYRDQHTHSVSGQYGLDESSKPYDQTDSSLYLEETTVASQRLTPAKFPTAHIKGSISSGHLVKVFPHYPVDGQAASVEISNLQDLLSNDDEYSDLVQFPGPLLKGVTHKKTIIEYCENKIRNAIYSRNIVDVDSYILMWELLILLLRQNGMVVGTDIAELLMKDRKQTSRRGSIASNTSSLPEGTAAETANLLVSDTHSSSTSILKEEVVTNKFREYLIYGSGKEALEWAMKHGLWGHALFLASKLDKRTYANVMTRFANGLTMNDPLQTLYQLLSGKVPAAVTCVSDEKWGDWRPHLAMILSNTTQRPELDRKAITTLADTLSSRGSLYAAQFCYLMAQVGFSRYGTEGAKLVLLGSNHNKPFLEFALNEAIHMTEVYEYACSLNDATFVIPEFLPYKYLLATRLADRGLLEKSLAYLEKITLAILQNPGVAQSSLVTQVCQLGEKLKYYDPVEEEAFEGDGTLDTSRPDHSWLKELKAIESDFNMGLISNEGGGAPETDVNSAQVQQPYEALSQESWQQQYVEQQQYQQTWQQNNQYTEQVASLDYQNQIPNVYGTENYQDQQAQQPYWGNQAQWNEGSSDQNPPKQDNIDQHPQNDYWNNTAQQEEVVEKKPDEDIPRPQISMPNQSRGFDENKQAVAQTAKIESPHKPKPLEKPATTGWFGGIWNKLSLRPKNQMKLPDDKNPTIVWDEQKKRWINLHAEGDGGQVEIKPPPKMTDMFPNPSPMGVAHVANQEQPTVPQPQPNYLNSNPIVHNEPIKNDTSTIQASQNFYNSNNVTNNNNTLGNNFNPQRIDESSQPKPSQPNMFKLQRGRNLKKSYVDVFNPGAKNGGAPAPLPAPDAFGGATNNSQQMNFFIPAPVTDPNAPTDFLTPTPLHQYEDNSQMSRWSSASSLSKEVQYYMQHKPVHR